MMYEKFPDPCLLDSSEIFPNLLHKRTGGKKKLDIHLKVIDLERKYVLEVKGQLVGLRINGKID